MTQPRFEVADIARNHGYELIARNKLNAHQKKVMTAITNCRTAKPGGHKERCTNKGCTNERFAYNGCRDRHCPKCNGLKREKWIASRKEDALPVPYFHIVFTVPDPLEKQCLTHGSEMYNLLFKTAWDTICDFAKEHKYLGAKMGMIALLHTWGQNIMRHTHIHCLVPAGGINANGKWRMCKNNGKFFVHVKQISKVFRGKFTDGLLRLQQEGLIKLETPLVKGKKHLHPLYKNKWVVYAKAPLPTSDKVVEYIGRYSHRIAISNHRIKAFEDRRVSFSWVDYRTSKTGLMDIKASDFLQRFFSHVLPPKFIKIRHYGILASKNKAIYIQMIRDQLGAGPRAMPVKGLNWMETFELIYGKHPKLCPCCKKGLMISVYEILPSYKIRPRDGPELEANTGFYSNRE